ncbi:MAG: hypothetical protein HND52_20200 [Ignavibacteriae bacterium]|nr:hypothetical protein [Ignavibacteriota bacterium]NOH00293.1 hypothetical protein [Ignavibacteriota bacterium]
MSTSLKGVWQFGITYEYNSLNSVYAGASKLNDDTRERLTQSIIIETNYGITNSFRLTALFSFVNQTRSIDPIYGISNELSSRGFGDALIMLKYNLISLNILDNRELAFGAGLKVPLGKSEITSGEILLPADMQPGTGSWDGVFWAYYSEKLFVELPLNIFINASYKINSTNERFGINRGGYKFGNEFISSIGFGYRTDTFIDFTLFARFRNTNPDEFGDQDISNTGGNWLYLVPGINFKIYQTLTARLSSQLPLYRELKGTQLTTTFTTALSLFISIGGLSNPLRL